MRQDPAPTAIEEVVVVAPRSELPASTSAAKVRVVTREELERTGERSLPRAIGKAAGVWIQESNLGGGSPVIRGLLGNQVLIMVDGVRLNDATTRFGPNQILNTIDPAVVERVEVIRGASSLLYGSDAIGGVIAIWTRRRAPANAGGPPGVGGEVHARYDSATAGGSGALQLDGAGEDLGVLGIASGARWDDLTAGGDTEQPFTGYHSAGTFGSLDWALDPERTLRLTTMIHRDFNVPRTFQVVPGFGQPTAPFVRFDFALQEREDALLTFDDRVGGALADRMQLRLFLRQYTEQRVRRRTGSSVQRFGETQVETVGLGADWYRDTSAGRWSWGLDLSNDQVDSFNLETDFATGDQARTEGDFAPDARYTSFGAFVRNEIWLGERTDLTLGLRWSYFDFAFDQPGLGRRHGDFDALTAAAELGRELSDAVGVTATVAQGFQAPNLEDLANDGEFAGGTEFANPNLDPAQSLMGELALEVLEPQWSGTAALFVTRIDDYIGRHLLDAGAPGVSGDETYLRANAGRVDLWGLELAGRRELGAPGTPWSVEGSASWVRARQYDATVDPNTGTAPLDGVEARRIPPVHGWLGLAWRGAERRPRWLDEGQLALFWALDQNQLHPDDLTDPRIDPRGTDGWTTWNLEFGGPLAEDVRWGVSLVNLLDERYRVHGSGLDGPGRSFVVTLQARF